MRHNIRFNSQAKEIIDMSEYVKSSRATEYLLTYLCTMSDSRKRHLTTVLAMVSQTADQLTINEKRKNLLMGSFMRNDERGVLKELKFLFNHLQMNESD